MNIKYNFGYFNIQLIYYKKTCTLSFFISSLKSIKKKVSTKISSKHKNVEILEVLGPTT